MPHHDTQPDTDWRPDGFALYRREPRTGRLIGMLPATCKRQLHSLGKVGYRASENGNELTVTCLACQADDHPDHSWILLVTRPERPDAAELFDGAYATIKPFYFAGEPERTARLRAAPTIPAARTPSRTRAGNRGFVNE